MLAICCILKLNYNRLCKRQTLVVRNKYRLRASAGVNWHSSIKLNGLTTAEDLADSM